MKERKERSKEGRKEELKNVNGYHLEKDEATG